VFSAPTRAAAWRAPARVAVACRERRKTNRRSRQWRQPRHQRRRPWRARGRAKRYLQSEGTGKRRRKRWGVGTREYGLARRLRTPEEDRDAPRRRPGCGRRGEHPPPDTKIALSHSHSMRAAERCTRRHTRVPSELLRASSEAPGDVRAHRRVLRTPAAPLPHRQAACMGTAAHPQHHHVHGHALVGVLVMAGRGRPRTQGRERYHLRPCQRGSPRTNVSTMYRSPPSLPVERRGVG
jgi:hypothetical protein